jgi:ADP-ribose pyrophosphatase YjhB (NUDIX family)
VLVRRPVHRAGRKVLSAKLDLADNLVPGDAVSGVRGSRREGTMEFGVNVFDLWVFHREGRNPRYLLLHTSQEKADRWFGGGRFWQIPGGFIEQGRSLESAQRAVLDELGLVAKSLWVVEHVYAIYNRRRARVELIPVFAAEVAARDIPLTWEHSEFGWYSAAECESRLSFRALTEGLAFLRQFVTEAESPRAEFRLA